MVSLRVARILQGCSMLPAMGFDLAIPTKLSVIRLCSDGQPAYSRAAAGGRV
jgi:hypothetical protein